MDSAGGDPLNLNYRIYGLDLVMNQGEQIDTSNLPTLEPDRAKWPGATCLSALAGSNAETLELPSELGEG